LAITTGDVQEKGSIFTSSNSGMTWVSNNAPVAYWLCIAGSADGTTLLAGNSTSVYTSTDSGAAWTSNSLPPYEWVSVACSAKGTTMAAASYIGYEDGEVYLSTNFGAAWTNTGLPRLDWYSVAVSADGSKIAAAYTDDGVSVYTSTNAGFSWRSNRFSAEESPLFAAGSDGGTMAIYLGSSSSVAFSMNWGSTWITNSLQPPRVGAYFAMSADGTRWMAAGGDADPVETLLFPPSLSVASSGGNLLISWPAPCAGWSLQQNSDLTTTNWNNVTDAVVVTNYQNQVTITLPTAGNRFY
jgi:hypothetical protein